MDTVLASYYRAPDRTVDRAAVLAVDKNTGSILGQAGPCFIRPDSRLTVAGVMKFDSADVRGLIDNGKFKDVIVHEMGHVLGVGTLVAFVVVALRLRDLRVRCEAQTMPRRTIPRFVAFVA